MNILCINHIHVELNLLARLCNSRPQISVGNLHKDKGLHSILKSLTVWQFQNASDAVDRPGVRAICYLYFHTLYSTGRCRKTLSDQSKTCCSWGSRITSAPTVWRFVESHLKSGPEDSDETPPGVVTWATSTEELWLPTRSSDASPTPSPGIKDALNFYKHGLKDVFSDELRPDDGFKSLLGCPYFPLLTTSKMWSNWCVKLDLFEASL